MSPSAFVCCRTLPCASGSNVVVKLRALVSDSRSETKVPPALTVQRHPLARPRLATRAGAGIRSVARTSRTDRSLDVTPGFHDPPRVVIAQTTFGKGVTYMESRIEWHYLPLSDAHYEQAMEELDIETLGKGLT